MKNILHRIVVFMILCAILALPVSAADANWEAYQQYVYSFAASGAPTPEDAASMEAIILRCGTMDELLAAPELGVFFAVMGAMDYDSWVDAGMPAEGAPRNAGASGEASSGEPSGDPSGEPSGEPSAEADPEQAYKEYLHEWLIAEDEVNDTMTEDIRENEFMPLIWAGDYETFPAEMLWNGMLENGCPMTYEEFLAQYPAAGTAPALS